MQSSRSSTGVRRLGVLVGPVLVGAVVLSSCGGGETAATQSTIDLSSASTAFVVRPPATTEPPADTAGDPDAVVEGTQEYTVQSGDYPFLLVERFGVTLEDLLGVNEWTNPNQFPGPGTVILIPPGGRSVAAATAPRRRKPRATRRLRHRALRPRRSPTQATTVLPARTPS
jgi:LysM repeat protein